MLRILSSVDGADGASTVIRIPSGGRFARHVRPPAASDMPDTNHMLTISAGGFDAHATCIVGQTQGAITYLTYVSLLGPGTTVVAIWANLMDHRTTVVTLEGVGTVQLWNRQPAFAELGYRLSWRRRHRVLHLDHGARVVHLVTEPDLLTMRDPLLADAAARNRRESGSGSGGHARDGGDHANHLERHEGRTGDPSETGGGKGIQEARDPRAASSGNSRQPAAAMEQVNEQVARDTRPLFVLLSRRGEDMHSLACRHLLFLAERVQWLAYYEPWADFFWKRGLRTGEITSLSVWPASDSAPTSATENGLDMPNVAPTSSRWITAAYLCQPNPFALAESLPEVVRAQAAEGASSNGTVGAAHTAQVLGYALGMALLPSAPAPEGGTDQ